METGKSPKSVGSMDTRKILPHPHPPESGNSASAAAKWTFRILGFLLAMVGLALLAGGVQLVMLGGSAYYLLAGLGLILSGVLLGRRDVRSAWLFGIVYIGTIIWALWEAGLAFWPQVPRIGPFLVMGIVMSLAAAHLSGARRRWFTFTARLW